MTVTYSPSQAGNEAAGVWTPNVLSVSSAGITGGIQFTVPAPNEFLWRSIVLTMTPTAVVGNGTFSIAMCSDFNEQAFGAGNLPTNQATIPVYSAAHAFVVATPVSFTLNLGVTELQSGQFVGRLETASQVLGHSSFQGNVALVLTDTAATLTFNHATASLVGDVVPFLSGLPTSKPKLSRADWCPRCGSALFREELTRDGYTESLVCRQCYDPPEQRRRRWTVPKEVNP